MGKEIQLFSHVGTSKEWHLAKLVGNQGVCLCGMQMVVARRVPYASGMVYRDADHVPEDNEPPKCAACWMEAEEWKLHGNTVSICR